ncbi:DNA repair protein RecN [Lachnospira multipara]|uniref:DNA repair protein RecN n=1 Tax=Lachnospira multipara TaxID=28051 RepID=UPI00047FC76B|nr:DNA repair protein RecN [Lachnospira multipara]
MLVNLHVKNLALIEEENIDFSEGLNILTGETGAGKSIILGSISAALGAKCSPEFIRTGCEYGLAEVTFSIEDNASKELIKDLGVLDIDEGELVISRKISAQRSQFKVNGQSFTASQTRQLANLLINIHGQRDNLILIDENNQLNVIDEYCMDYIKDTLIDFKEAYKNYKSLKAELDELDINEDERQRQISFLEYEINEIESATLTINEDEEVEKKYNKMRNFQKIMEELDTSSNLLYLGEDNISDMISEIFRAVTKASEYDESLVDAKNTLSSIEDLIGDVSHQISNYISDLEFNEEEFNQLEQRLDLINNLKMKYGKTIEQILLSLEEKQNKLEELENLNSVVERKKEELEKAKDKALSLASTLSDTRKEKAMALKKEFIKALKELNFLDVKFEIEFNSKEMGTNGIDEITFMISTNPGEELKPLAKVSSGGELSRIMLAIKSVMASKNDQKTYIFDEIDAGISGKTASLVATKLAKLSNHNQIICITHLPQIAAMASKHFIIEKSLANNRTISNIRGLNEEDSLKELARLLGDGEITKATLLNATELKRKAKDLILL